MSLRLLGPLVERLWPSPAREPHISTQEGLMGSLDYFTRSIGAGLLFPFIAYAVGLLFRNVIHGQARRTIVVSQLLKRVKCNGMASAWFYGHIDIFITTNWLVNWKLILLTLVQSELSSPSLSTFMHLIFSFLTFAPLVLHLIICVLFTRVVLSSFHWRLCWRFT